MILKVQAPLDKQFEPLSVALRDYEKEARESKGHVTLALAIERNQGFVYRKDFAIFAPGVQEERTVTLFERVVKTMLWVSGGYRVYISGCKPLFECVRAA